MICEKCGKPVAPNSDICENCGAAVENVQVEQAAPAELAKPENVATGIVGALIGALIGGASIVLLDQLGVVAALSGLLLAFCTMKGYELLGHKLSIKGIVISAILMVVMPFVAYNISTAIYVIQFVGEDGVKLPFSIALQAIPFVLGDGFEVGNYTYTLDKAAYIMGIAKLYLFVAIGGVGLIVNAFKKKK